MMIHSHDLCRCGVVACGHTTFVFFGERYKEWVPIEKIWANNNAGYIAIKDKKCTKFMPKDNLKYLELLYEQRR